MEENKTGVWIQNGYGTLAKLKQSSIYPINTKDRICIMSPKYNVICEVKRISYYSDSTRASHYYLNPVQSIYGAGLAAISPENTTGYLYIMVHRDDGTLVFDGDLIEEYLKCGYVNSNTSKVIIFPKGQETMNEDLEIHTGTILADEIKIGTLAPPPLSERRVSALPHYQQKPITATSEAAKNFKKEYYGTFGAERELKSQIPTTELGQTLKKISDRMGDITISDLGESHIEFKEKEMYTKNLKEMIKKPIYVDKEITVKEPMLDNNGKQIEKDGKPVFKVKHYHGMVKILWVSGAETVAYVEGNDVYDRENGFKTCVLKYLCGNAGAHDAVDFWTNKYVKYPSSCIEVTENLCKLEKILEKDKYRKDDQKGLPHAKFLRRIAVNCIAEFSSDKLHYMPNDSKLASEFKKLAKKYFPELKGTEIYINNNKQDEVFVAIK